MFFSSVSKFEGCITEENQQHVNKQRLVHLKKQSEKKREKWKQNFRIPVNQSRAVSPDDEEIFELGALADQKESGCVWVRKHAAGSIHTVIQDKHQEVDCG